MTKNEIEYITNLYGDYKKVESWLKADEKDLANVTIKELEPFFNIYKVLKDNLTEVKDVIRKKIDAIAVTNI